MGATSVFLHLINNLFTDSINAIILRFRPCAAKIAGKSPPGAAGMSIAKRTKQTTKIPSASSPRGRRRRQSKRKRPRLKEPATSEPLRNFPHGFAGGSNGGVEECLPEAVPVGNSRQTRCPSHPRMASLPVRASKLRPPHVPSARCGMAPDGIRVARGRINRNA